jgi:hypothetical protein
MPTNWFAHRVYCHRLVLTVHGIGYAPASLPRAQRRALVEWTAMDPETRARHFAADVEAGALAGADVCPLDNRQTAFCATTCPTIREREERFSWAESIRRKVA